MLKKLSNPYKFKNNDLLSNNKAADYLGITPATLDVWRCTKRYPIPFIKVGRLVKYRQSDLDEFLEQQTIIRGNCHE